MESPSFVSLILACVLLAFIPCFLQSNLPLLGVHPLDEKYYSSEAINCRDGSKSFSRDRLNDNFCDCADGTDEPGTSACSAGKFYCRNVGSKPEFIFSSHVNDHYCDCCDGSDEYDGNIHCPNICVMGGNSEYGNGNYNSKVSDVSSFVAREMEDRVKVEESLHNLDGLKVAVIMQVVLTIFAVVLWCFHSRTRSRRRHYN